MHNEVQHLEEIVGDLRRNLDLYTDDILETFAGKVSYESTQQELKEMEEKLQKAKEQRMSEIQPRPSVMEFARRMEETLRSHDAKKGGQKEWRKCSLYRMFQKLEEEVRELGEEILDYEDSDISRILSEAVDVGNIAMMISDLVAGLADDE